MDLTQPSTGEILFPGPRNLRKFLIQLPTCADHSKEWLAFCFLHDIAPFRGAAKRWHKLTIPSGLEAGPANFNRGGFKLDWQPR